ncbi:hypothetical protein SynBOUM118_02332 [Synechococcus sp. BOUM118]|nr:hypothetical protein SynBOUM118_02332 [Synechococcus sp. BOUM118]
MKSYKQFISEAREAKAFLAGELPLCQRKKKKVGQKVISKRKSNDLSQRDGASGISPSSDPSPEVDNSNLIYVGGNYMGRPDYSESVDVVVDVMNRLYPVPEWKLMEDTQSSFYIFRTDTQQVLAKGVVGYDNAKQRASYLRKRHGLKFDQVRFKKEGAKTGGSGRRTGGQTFRGGRVDTAKNYNPSKRGHFRGVNYPDGSYADLD